MAFLFSRQHDDVTGDLIRRVSSETGPPDAR